MRKSFQSGFRLFWNHHFFVIFVCNCEKRSWNLIMLSTQHSAKILNQLWDMVKKIFTHTQQWCLNVLISTSYQNHLHWLSRFSWSAQTNRLAGSAWGKCSNDQSKRRHRKRAICVPIFICSAQTENLTWANPTTLLSQTVFFYSKWVCIYYYLEMTT